jgi:hypothetical protein
MIVSENAVMTQIMAAWCVYLLLAYLKFQSKISRSRQEIIRLSQLTLFARRFLLALLQPPGQGSSTRNSVPSTKKSAAPHPASLF